MKRNFTKFGMLVVMLLTFLPTSAYDFKVDGFYYSVVSLSDLTCEVAQGENEYFGDIIIPGKVTYNNRELTVVGVGTVFKSNKLLTSITLPESITEIGESAFNSCSSLTSITMPNSLTKIGFGAFGSCSSLTSITIPDSVTEIGVMALSGCSVLTSVILSNSLTAIEYGTFRNCKSLSSLTIPGSLEYISMYYASSEKNSFTFENCDNLTKLNIEYGESKLNFNYTRLNFNNTSWNYSHTTFYESNVFVMNNEDEQPLLETVYIDRELDRTIDLPYLKDYTIGEHISKNQVNLNNSANLESLTCYAIKPPTLGEATNAQYLNVVVRVPQESLEAYQQADGWKNFWNLQGFDLSGVEEISADSVAKVETGRYDLNGMKVTEDYKGIVIIRYSDGSARKLIQR